MAGQQRIHPVASVLAALAVASAPAFAQDTWPPHPTSRLGLNVADAAVPLGCGASLLPCSSEQAALATARQPHSLRWSVELSALNLASAPRVGWWSGRQGLRLAVVGRQPLFGSSFSLYGRLGTTATSALGDTVNQIGPAGLGDTGYGMAFGAGVSMDVTRRLSASFGVDSYDLRAGGVGPVRSTSMGLQYRY